MPIGVTDWQLLPTIAADYTRVCNSATQSVAARSALLSAESGVQELQVR